MRGILIQVLNLYLICIFARIVLSWFPINPGSPVATISGFLYSITEPVLGPLRNVLPSIGMFDLSPMVVIFAIQLVIIPILRGQAEMADKDMTADEIRAVQFREKVRGYHPTDVDAFVASAAETVDKLERTVRETSSRLAEVESRTSATAEAEDALRRTLVLAQRTADLAMQEAREQAAQIQAETAAERERAQRELDELRTRVVEEAQEEGRRERDRLAVERTALQADVDALHAHLERERERLRIYFNDQLRRVDGGEPGTTPPPPMQAPEPVATAPAAAPVAEENDHGDAVASAPDATAGGGDAEATADGDGDTSPEHDDDPFLAELRRAVTDEQPLGPREDDVNGPGEGGDDDFDFFAKNDQDGGRFGSRLRRRR